MVAIIKVAHSLRRIFNYNENKVKEGVAECIGAENYPLSADEMNLKMKLNFLLKRNELNENVKRNSIHVSLNFDPSEKAFPKEKLMAIAGSYMQKIGFGEQPFLVYQHHDAGHPHIHLVATNIQADGSRIDMHHLGIRKSEPARKEIEKTFGLVVAEGRKEGQRYKLEPITMGKIRYGKLQSKKALTNILIGVLDTYKYTSLPELNAVLRQYNVLADRGGENSRVFKSGGLVYRILNEDGKPVGVPIKASDFYNAPTMKFLGEKFKNNEAKRMPFKSRIRNAVDLALRGKDVKLQDLVKALEKQGIHMALRQNETGLIYGITYVDHITKCVFNGSALGKRYSAKAVQERCQQGVSIEQKPSLQLAEKQQILQQNNAQAEANPTISRITLPAEQTIPIPDIGKALDALMQPEQTSDFLPYQLKSNKKKKRRKRISNNQ